MKLHTYGLLRNSFRPSQRSAGCGRTGVSAMIWCGVLADTVTDAEGADAG